MKNKFIKNILLLLLFVLLPIRVFAQNESNNSKENSKIDRNISQQMVVPKGQWILGLKANYNHFKAKDYNLFVINKANLEGYSLAVSPFVLYSFRDNMALGLQFSYDRSLSRLDNVELGISESLKTEIKDLYKLEQTYSGVATFRQYLNMGDLRRFAFFTDIQLGLYGGQAKILNGKGDKLSGTYETKYGLGLGVSPGIVAFMSNFAATEISVGLLGVDYSTVKQTSNQVTKSERNESKGNFWINIFAIKLGLPFYI